MTSTPESSDASATDETTVDVTPVEGVDAAAETAPGAEPTSVDEAEAPVAEADAPVDERLTAAHDLALAALAEITPAATIGDPVDYVVEAGGVVSLRFQNRLAGYPGWLWTVSVAVVPDAEPTVLEVELLPAAGALLAPEWVPWAVRLAEYQAAQTAAAGEEADEDEDDAEGDDELDDDADDLDDDDLGEDDDADDFADGSTAVTHAGDVDGVDIDSLDAAADDDDDDDEDADDDEEGDADDDEDSDHDESPWER